MKSGPDNYWQRRVQRRRLLQIGVMTGIGGVVLPLIGCSSSNNNGANNAAKSSATSAAPATTVAATRAATAAPGASPAATRAATAAASPAAAAANVKRGGTLKFGFSRDFEGFDPGKVTDSYVGFLFLAGIYDPLVGYTPDYQVTPTGLASKWETPDQTTLTFTIRDGVTFHDGTALTADIVKQNIDRIVGSGSTAKDKASLSAIDSTTASGSTFTIKLKNPDAVVLPVLGDYAGMIASPKAFDSLLTQPVGTGAFKFQNWNKGASVSLVKNDSYWGTGPGGKLPYLDGMQTAIIPDAEQLLNSLKSGQVDLLVLITGDTINRIKGDNSMVYISGPSRLVRTQFINMAWENLGNPVVRQAVSQAIDRKQIVDNVYAGHAQVAATMGTPGDWVFDSSIQPYQYDVANAKKLLAQANLGGGFKVDVKTTGAPGEFQTISDLIRPQLRQVGIDMNYVTIDATASFKIIYTDGNTGFNVAGNDGRADFAQVVDLSFSKTGTFNLAPHFDKNWQSDPDIDALVAKGRQTLDQAQRKSIYKDLQQQVHDKVYSQDVLCYPEQGWAAAKKVQGLQWYQDARFRLQQVWLQG